VHPQVPHVVPAFGFVWQRARNAGFDILNERASKRDIENLRAAADCENGFAGLARGEYKRYFSLIATAVHGAEALVTRLPVERWVDVFAAGEHQTIRGSDYGARSRRVQQWGNDDWYEPC
jgi:hypothetical protein